MNEQRGWAPGTTHWSQLLDPQARHQEAWRFFYERYKDAVLALYRRSGVEHDSLEDLTHEFFASSLQSEFLAKADPSRGRFRGYLCTAARRFLASERRKSGRQKRQPERLVSLDSPHSAEPAAGPTPQEEFDLHWARAVLARALDDAKQEAVSEGRANHCEAFELRQQGVDWQTLADRLETSIGAARGWVTRYERRVAEGIRKEVLPTVSGQAELEAELKDLSEILSRG